MLGINVQTVYTMARRGELEKVSSVSRQCRAVHRTKRQRSIHDGHHRIPVVIGNAVTTLYLALVSSVSTCQVDIAVRIATVPNTPSFNLRTTATTATMAVAGRAGIK